MSPVARAFGALCVGIGAVVCLGAYAGLERASTIHSARLGVLSLVGLVLAIAVAIIGAVVALGGADRR